MSEKVEQCFTAHVVMHSVVGLGRGILLATAFAGLRAVWLRVVLRGRRDAEVPVGRPVGSSGPALGAGQGAGSPSARRAAWGTWSRPCSTPPGRQGDAGDPRTSSVHPEFAG